MVLKLKNAIQWHEGMLLQPHHFQQADRRVEQLLGYGLAASGTHPWGILHFSYDIAALATGMIRIWEIEAILPDGTVISFQQGEGEDLFLNLDPYSDDLKRQSLTVYLGLPTYRAGQSNAAGDQPRFRSTESSIVVDENTGEGQLSFPALKPNICLLVAADQPPATHVCLPLLKIHKVSNRYQLIDFIPPHFKVLPQSALGQLCNGVAQQIREKAAFLTERLNDKTAELMSAEAESALKALAIGLVPFETVLASGVIHPFTLYTHLVQLAAQLMAIFPAQMPPNFMPYNHNDIDQNFRQIIRFIEVLLDRIQEGYAILVFDLENRIFSLLLTSEIMTSSRGRPRLIIGAKASPGMSEKEVMQWISQSLIATQDHVSSCRDRRILGAPRHFISGDEELRLMPARNVVLFTIDPDPEFITSGETLKLFNVGDSDHQRPEEIVLYLSRAEKT